MGGQFWSVYVPATLTPTEAARETFEQIDTVRRIVAAHPDVFELATTADDVERIHAAGKIASLIGMEGGYSIDDSLGLLREFHQAGVALHDPDPLQDHDLGRQRHRCAEMGRAVAVRRDGGPEMNRLGMMVDLSHVSEETMLDAMRVSEAPVIFSHSSARAVTDHPRNVPDSVLRADGGGRRGGHGDLRARLHQRGAGRLDDRRSSRGGAAGRRLNAGIRRIRRLLAWAEAHPRPTPRSPTWSPTSSMCAMWRASTTSAWAAISTASPALPDGIEGVDAYPRILAALMDGGLDRGRHPQAGRRERAPRHAGGRGRGGVEGE